MLDQLLPLEKQYKFQIYPFKYQDSALFIERQQWIQKMDNQCQELGIENRKYIQYTTNYKHYKAKYIKY